MPDQPLYEKVVAGYEENERGEDALVLAGRVVERDGGELKVVHVEKGSPADAFQALAEKGEADLSCSARRTMRTSDPSRREASPSTCSRARAAA